MIAGLPPIFVAAGSRGFKASYSLTFAADINYLIYLHGGLQGDSVVAKTMKIDNSRNGSACTISMRGDSQPIPAYTTQYVDCVDALDAVISAGSNSSIINIEILTYSIPESSITNKNLSVGSKPPISYSSGILSVYTVATKYLSLNSPITSYVDIAVNPSSGAGVKWGFTSATTNGEIGVGGTYSVNMDGSINELWIVTNNTPTFGFAAFNLNGG